MAGLRAARDVAAPDWLIAAGAIRDAVWDDLHGRPLTTPPRDIDVGFFDPDDLTPERDARSRPRCTRRAPQLPWDAKNQAAVHLWYPERFGIAVEPFRATAEAVATFPETATASASGCSPDDEILVVAPHGLDDLFACVCRHNPTRVIRGVLRQRVAEKGWESAGRGYGLPARPAGHPGMETPEESGAGYPEEQPSRGRRRHPAARPGAGPSGGEGTTRPTTRTAPRPATRTTPASRQEPQRQHRDVVARRRSEARQRRVRRRGRRGLRTVAVGAARGDLGQVLGRPHPLRRRGLGDAVGVEQDRLARRELGLDVGQPRVVDEAEQRALDGQLLDAAVGPRHERRRVAADRDGQVGRALPERSRWAIATVQKRVELSASITSLTQRRIAAGECRRAAAARIV